MRQFVENSPEVEEGLQRKLKQLKRVKTLIDERLQTVAPGSQDNLIRKQIKLVGMHTAIWVRTDEGRKDALEFERKWSRMNPWHHFIRPFRTTV